MSQSGEISPIASVEFVREGAGLFRDFLQMISETVPILGWAAFYGMGIVFFVFHGLFTYDQISYSFHAF
jgi:hypothetical protein